MHKSIATIDSPEFINLQPLDINPLMSSCEIKVLYLGENRNQSFISKDVATEMAKTLRGAPIVGYYKNEKEDFADHGSRMILDDEGIKFECLTKPYGFVSPDAKVWFQTFEDTDEFGNKETREYLMTTGYLWTGQFEECKVAVDEGRPHSMELDEKTLDGHWARNKNRGMDFFIINDAVFSKLCILGDDVEPCFEGSSVTAPKVSVSFTKMDDAFRKTLFTMMQELQFALQGGQQMENEVKTPEVVEEVVKTPVEPSVDNTNTPVVEPAEVAPTAEEVVPAMEDISAASENSEEGTAQGDVGMVEEVPVEPEIAGDFAKKKDDDNDEDNKNSDEDSDTQKNDEDDDKDDEEKKKKDFELLQADFTALQEKYDALVIERNELATFKANIEDAQKDEMIKSFYYLSDEDKKDVIANKSKYTLEEIESKLSVICVRNKVNFNLDNNDKNDINTEKDAPITTYSINDVGGESVPAWINAVKNIQNKK